MSAQAYCATVIANLEGWRGEALPSTAEGRRLTMDKLEMRIRRLEDIEGINAPTLMQMLSWNSLVYRVARLHSYMSLGSVSTMNERMAASLPIIPTLGLLRRYVAVLGGVGPQSWAAFIGEDEEIEEDDLLQAAAQFLCHLAGRRGYMVIGSFSLSRNCALALDMSLDADTNLGSRVWPALYNDRLRPRQGAEAHLRLQHPNGHCEYCSCTWSRPSSVGYMAPSPGVWRWIAGRRRAERERPGGRCVREWISGVSQRRFPSFLRRRRPARENESDFSSSNRS